MGAYICALCNQMFCHHETICYEYGKNKLICEDCYFEKEDKKQEVNP